MFALTYSGLQEIKNYEVNPNIDSFFANTIPGEYFHTFFQDSIIMLSNKKTAYVKNTKTNKAQFIKSKTILPLIKNNKLFYISHYTLFEQENKKTSSGPSICENNRKSFIIYDAEYGNFFTYSIDGTLKKYYTIKIKFNTAF